jgi:hypothetical protein
MTYLSPITTARNAFLNPETDITHNCLWSVCVIVVEVEIAFSQLKLISELVASPKISNELNDRRSTCSPQRTSAKTEILIVIRRANP